MVYIDWSYQEPTPFARFGLKLIDLLFLSFDNKHLFSTLFLGSHHASFSTFLSSLLSLSLSIFLPHATCCLSSVLCFASPAVSLSLVILFHSPPTLLTLLLVSFSSSSPTPPFSVPTGMCLYTMWWCIGTYRTILVQLLTGVGLVAKLKTMAHAFLYFVCIGG